MSTDEIRRYLDGDLPRDALARDARGEAEAWDRMLAAFRADAPPTPAPHWLEDRVMAQIEALPEPAPLARAWRWLVRPQAVSFRPASLGLAAAAVLALLLLVPLGDTPPPAVPDGAASVVYVQFSLRAPDARSVAVGGDFDLWRGSHALEDPDGDGVWTGRVPVEPGLHSYMFLVDGDEWVTDPGASRYSDDGFGNRNAVLAVAAPTT